MNMQHYLRQIDLTRDPMILGRIQQQAIDDHEISPMQFNTICRAVNKKLKNEKVV